MLRKVILVALLAFVAYRLLPLVLMFGFHRVVYNHAPGPCWAIPNIKNGSENMAYIPGNKALITTGLRFTMRNLKQFAGRTARVYEFDFNNPKDGFQEVTFSKFCEHQECDLHGISTWVDEETGEVRVFIVNHLESNSYIESDSVVEMFTYDSDTRTLNHLQTVGRGDSTLRLLNDVVAVGPDQFYVTNYAYSRLQLEMFLTLRLGSVAYFDGKTIKQATPSTLLMPNGLDRSPDGKYIYLAGVGDREIVTFTRNTDDTLSIKTRTPLYTVADNIVVDPETGDLWLGCHPIGYKFGEVVEDPENGQSPSQVLRLRMSDGSCTDMTEVFVDDGSRVSGSSVALYRKNQMLIGTVMSGALYCEVNYIPE